MPRRKKQPLPTIEELMTRPIAEPSPEELSAPPPPRTARKMDDMPEHGETTSAWLCRRTVLQTRKDDATGKLPQLHVIQASEDASADLMEGMYEAEKRFLRIWLRTSHMEGVNVHAVLVKEFRDQPDLLAWLYRSERLQDAMRKVIRGRMLANAGLAAAEVLGGMSVGILPQRQDGSPNELGQVDATNMRLAAQDLLSRVGVTKMKPDAPPQPRIDRALSDLSLKELQRLVGDMESALQRMRNVTPPATLEARPEPSEQVVSSE